MRIDRVRHDFTHNLRVYFPSVRTTFNAACNKNRAGLGAFNQTLYKKKSRVHTDKSV